MNDKVVRVIGILSDIHILSRWSVFPKDGLKFSNGDEIKPVRPHQAILYDYLMDFGTQLTKFGADTILLNGDTLHGVNHKDYAQNVMSTDPLVQREAAVQILSPLCQGRNVWMTCGSGYHDLFMKEMEICEALEGFWGGMAIRKEITPSGRFLHATHESPKALIALERECFTAPSAAYGKGKMARFDIHIRSHWHHFRIMKSADGLIIQSPCFTLVEESRITRKTENTYIESNDIGGVILLFHESGHVDVREFLYNIKNHGRHVG
jgi:hypothetical protein